MRHKVDFIFFNIVCVSAFYYLATCFDLVYVIKNNVFNDYKHAFCEPLF